MALPTVFLSAPSASAEPLSKAGQRVSKEILLKHFIGVTWIGSSPYGTGYVGTFKRDGTFKIEEFKIPNNAIAGTWKINVISGSNLDKTEFEVITPKADGIIIEIGDKIEIPGFGESIKVGITTSQKTSVTMQVFDQKSNLVGDDLSCTPTADFKCEILWTLPKDIIPGTYLISINDSKITVTKSFEIK